MIEVEAVCDWCGIREFVSLQDPHDTVDEWEAVTTNDTREDERPKRLADLIDKRSADVALYNLLCPDCRPHVAWKGGELYATDGMGAMLHDGRMGMYYGLESTPFEHEEPRHPLH